MQNERLFCARNIRLHLVFFGNRFIIALPFLLLFVKHWGDEPSTNNFKLATQILPFGHAHNDYLHKQPLFDALSHGFTSVEADVHLVGKQLYLGHVLPRIGAHSTLESAYLQPLHQLLLRQDNYIYPQYEGTFYLMIDIKTDSLETWEVLRSQLLRYPALLNNPRFRVFISGNRACWHIRQDPAHVAALDGRPSDLMQNTPAAQMPVVSDSFKSHFKWRGRGTMPETEQVRLRNMVQLAHRQGKQLRFWAIPDQPEAWQTLLDAGVDLINTDHLSALEEFGKMRSLQIVLCEE